MARRVHRSCWLKAPLVMVSLAVFPWGCTSSFGGSATYRYFEAPEPADPWSAKISGWQWREQRALAQDESPSPASVAGSAIASPSSAPGAAAGAEEARPDLRDKYVGFRKQQKRAVARQLAEWIQEQAREHYFEDGPVDHWATLTDTLNNDGDDCDGLELLVYHFLRNSGFDDNEVFRAIVFRPSDGQHHMVTLWFEDRDDPWVIDPTGAMTSGLTRMSTLPSWVPLKVFSEAQEYSVRKTHDRGSVARASLETAAATGD